MKHAAAMKYGGQLVSAAECTYDSFKQLVPLCPECKEPVYLRAGGERLSTKGKAYQIGSHWCHFKGVSAEQVASCENRVNNYTEKDRERISARARGQRLKLIQRWFWELFYNYWKSVAEDDHYEFKTEWRISNPPACFVEAFPKALQASYDCIALIKGGSDEALKYMAAINHKPVHKECDVKIAFEVFDFLTSKSCRNLLSEVYLLVSEMEYNMRMYANSIGCLGTPHPEQDSFDDALINEMDRIYNAPVFISDWLMISRLVLNSIFYIPWASEFERLEA